MRVRDFLKANGLKQRELATYLEITEAAVSNAVKGKSDFSKENLIKILNNPYGWDTSMLTESQEEIPAEEQRQPDTLDRLFAIVEEQRKDIATLLAMMKDKDEKIEEMRRELDSLKRGVAQSAVGSSGANVG